MKMNHAYRRLHTKCARNKWRLLWGLFFENSPFIREFTTYLMQTTPQRRQGRESSGPASLFEVNGRNRKSKSRCSSKAKRMWKSPPDSGTVDSDLYGLCFNLAQFTLYSSGHVLGCVGYLLDSPDTFVRIPHVFHTRESTVAGLRYGDTERSFEVYTHC